MGSFLYSLLAFMGGLLIAIQAALNSRLRFELNSPLFSALFSFSVGTALLLLIIFSRQLSGSEWRSVATGISRTPFWVMLGGVCGVGYVLSAILGIPKIGTVLFVAWLVLGQQLGALLIDHFAWFGVSEISINEKKLLGATFILVGVLIIQKN